jgi:hypothetical protein
MSVQHDIRSGQDRRKLDLSSVRNIEKERRDFSEDRRLTYFEGERPNTNRVVTRDYWGAAEDGPVVA